MKTNEMVAVTYSSELERLTAFENFPLLQKVKCAFQEVYRGKQTETIPSSRSKETMWTDFNKIWTGKPVTDAIREALVVSKDFCSWFLLMLQHVISEKSFPETHQVVPQQLNDDKKETVTYICGSIIRKLIPQFHTEMRRTKIENVSLIQKHIDIISACKDQDLVSNAPFPNSQKKLIDTLNMAGLIYPKIELFMHF